MRKNDERYYPVGSMSVLAVCSILSIGMYALVAWLIVSGIRALR